MKALATFALLGLAYTSKDNEFVVRPVYIPKKSHHENHEQIPVMSKPLPPSPMETSNNFHDNGFLVRPVHVPKKPLPHHEKIPEMSNPLPSAHNHEFHSLPFFNKHGVYSPPTTNPGIFKHWGNDELLTLYNHGPISSHSDPDIFFDDAEDNELAVIRPAIYYPPKPSNKPIYCDDEEDNELVVIRPAVYYPPKQSNKFLYCDDDELVQIVEAKNEFLALEKLKKEALVAAKELKKKHAVVEFMKVMKEAIEEDDDNFANLGEIIRDGIKRFNETVKKTNQQEGFTAKSKKH